MKLRPTIELTPPGGWHEATVCETPGDEFRAMNWPEPELPLGTLIGGTFTDDVSDRWRLLAIVCVGENGMPRLVRVCSRREHEKSFGDDVRRLQQAPIEKRLKDAMARICAKYVRSAHNRQDEMLRNERAWRQRQQQTRDTRDENAARAAFSAFTAAGARMNPEKKAIDEQPPETRCDRDHLNECRELVADAIAVRLTARLIGIRIEAEPEVRDGMRARVLEIQDTIRDAERNLAIHQRRLERARQAADDGNDGPVYHERYPDASYHTH